MQEIWNSSELNEKKITTFTEKEVPESGGEDADVEASSPEPYKRPMVFFLPPKLASV